MFDEDYKKIPEEALLNALVDYLRKLYDKKGWESVFALVAPHNLEGKSYSVWSIKNLEYCLNCEHKHDRKRKSVVVGTCLILDTIDIGLAGYCKDCYRENNDEDIIWAYDNYDSDTLNALYSDDEIKQYENSTKN
ncbi:MAG: hypothetical protein ACFFG0_22615 [Candidatus Thorarchaeota archaeon]